MTETLGELLRRSADAVSEPRVDVGELVAAGRTATAARRLARRRGRSRRGRRGRGGLARGPGWPEEPEPASPSALAAVPSEQRRRRPDRDASARVRRGLDRARRRRDRRRGRHRGLRRRHRRRRGVHDRLSLAQARVQEDTDGEWSSDTLWFNDGSTTEAIGRAPTEHIGLFEVTTSNPGSLVVWADATSREGRWMRPVRRLRHLAARGGGPDAVHRPLQHGAARRRGPRLLQPGLGTPRAAGSSTSSSATTRTCCATTWRPARSEQITQRPSVRAPSCAARRGCCRGPRRDRNRVLRPRMARFNQVGRRLAAGGLQRRPDRLHADDRRERRGSGCLPATRPWRREMSRGAVAGRRPPRAVPNEGGGDFPDQRG